MLPFALVLLAAAPPLETAPEPRAAPLTWVQAIRRLDVEAASRQLPLRLKGVVTYAGGSALRDLFLQDRSAGIYIKPSPFADGIRLGDTIEVEGVTDPGQFAPCVVPTKITKSGRDTLPNPLPFTMLNEDARWLDAQYVQAWGVVSAVEANDNFTLLTVYNAHGRVRLCIPDPNLAQVLTGLIDSAISVHGVCVPKFDPKERIILDEPTRVFSNQVPMVELRSDSTTSLAIDHLLRFVPDPHPGARQVTIKGVVTGHTTSGEFFIQDTSGGVMVAPATPAAVKPGDRVRVTGLVSIEGRRIRVSQARVESLGSGTTPVAVSTSLSVLARGRYHGVLATVQGRVDDFEPRDDEIILTIVDGAERLNVAAPLDIALPPLGSRVEVSGIYGKSLAGSMFWMRATSDLKLLELPAAPVQSSWWTTSRIVVMLAVPVVCAILAFAWVATLRQQVRRQTEELRKQFAKQTELEEKLRTSQKLEAIGRLAGGIAHDFNNLLTVINGCGELLSNELPPNSMEKDLVRDIRSAGERAASLVSQLLLFSRRQTVRLHSVDLRASLKEAERMLKRVIGETIQVQCDFASDTPFVKAESTLLQQVVLNLAVNARDAMPVGGTLHIATSRRQIDGRTVARLSVSDTGVGMDDATRARIFEPFFTTKSVGSGTGLGLATVYGIVQTLEGEIRCESTLGKGTTFEIDLPALDAQPQSHSQGSSHRAFTAGRGTILICEDDRAVRELTSQILQTAGYEVLAADTPTDAARLAKSHPGRIDLLLTDLVMPEMNGRDLAEFLQPLRPEMKNLFMTGYTEEEILRQGFEISDLVMVSKPFTPSILTSKINEQLCREVIEVSALV